MGRLRPRVGAVAPARGRGWAHRGPSGGGQFGKMVHKGIESGMMQCIAEGMALLERADQVAAPLAEIGELWQHGSVIRSWLLELTTDALRDNPTLEGVAPHVADSGEARWMVAEAIEQDLSAPVTTLSLLQRLRSPDAEGFAAKILASMRQRFGGHALHPGPPAGPGRRAWCKPPTRGRRRWPAKNSSRN